MQTRLMLIVMLAAIGLAVSASPAAAQSESCSSVFFTLSPDSGPTGTIVSLSGGGAFANVYIDIYLDDTDMNTQLTDINGDFYYLFAVPGNATPGPHTITFDGYDNEDNRVSCSRTFTVTAGATSVQSEAYSNTAAVTSLPNTGLLLLPVAGLALGGLGLAALGRRRLK